MSIKGIDLAGLLCTILILRAGSSGAKPLNSEDVASLLPATPQTTNDTLAAIVQDPVVKDAVQYAVGNGSLSGLVVKKNVVILPADAPATVLSHTEQILTVPATHLEDIRKNITEESQKEVSDGLGATQATYLKQLTTKDEPGSESNWSGAKVQIHVSPQESIDTQNLLPEDTANIKPEAPLPEGLVTEKLNLPEGIGDKVSVPVVAILDSSKAVDDKVESSIVALLPNNAETSSLANQLEFLENNREEIRREVERSVEPQLDIRWEDKGQLLKEGEDMDVAEDIVFRPLFRYRQEEEHRANYADSRSYRRSNYRRYSPYNGYNNYDFYNKQYYNNRPEYYNDY